MKIASYDIVFQEIPGEVTLALNLSGCPCRCKGCHSPHLWEDTGEELTVELLDGLTEQYRGLVTCVAFMGGDRDPDEVFRLAAHVQAVCRDAQSGTSVKTAWYSGRQTLPNGLSFQSALPMDYIKLGPYIESLGGLKSVHTNQRLYKRVGDVWEDITSSFRSNNFES